MKVVFDFDGTLANSHHLVISAVQEIVSKENGRPYTREEIEGRFIANSELLYPQFGIDLNTPGVRARMEDHWQEIARKNWGEITFFEGIDTLLKELKSLGATLYVLTLRDRESTTKVLEKYNFLSYFSKIGCGDDDIQKPHPHSLRDLIGESDFQDLEKIVMVGDSTVDLELAQNAQVSSIHVQWCPFAKKMRSHEFSPTYQAAYPLDCLGLIKRHWGLDR